MPLYRYTGVVLIGDFFEFEADDEDAVWEEADKRARKDCPGYSEIQGEVVCLEECDDDGA